MQFQLQLQVDVQAHLQGWYQIVSNYVAPMATDPNCNPQDVQGALPLSGGPAVLSAYHGLRVMGMGATNWFFPVFFHRNHVVVQSCLITFNHKFAL